MQVGMQNSIGTLKESLPISYKVKIVLPHNPTIMLRPEHGCSVLFIIIKIWKQPRWPSAGERINKERYIHSIPQWNIFQQWEDMEEASVHIAKRKETILNR